MEKQIEGVPARAQIMVQPGALSRAALRLLRQEGLALHCPPAEADLVAAAAELHPQIVICGSRRRREGLALCRRLREVAPGHVILLVRRPAGPDVVAGFAAGASYVLRAASDAELLRSRVIDCLDREPDPLPQEDCEAAPRRPLRSRAVSWLVDQALRLVPRLKIQIGDQ